jgi:hypothetical protein
MASHRGGSGAEVLSGVDSRRPSSGDSGWQLAAVLWGLASTRIPAGTEIGLRASGLVANVCHFEVQAVCQSAMFSNDLQTRSLRLRSQRQSCIRAAICPIPTQALWKSSGSPTRISCTAIPTGVAGYPGAERRGVSFCRQGAEQSRLDCTTQHQPISQSPSLIRFSYPLHRFFPWSFPPFSI